MVTPTSLRKQLYDLWVSNPYVTPKNACEQLKFPWNEKRKYVKKLLSEFRSYYTLGLPQKAQRLEKRTFEWSCIPRIYENGGEMPLAVWGIGWRPVKGNNNGMWVFRGNFGSVHWYKEGLVHLYLRGELIEAKAKELFCKAFSFMTQDKAFFERFLDVPLRETYRKWIFEIGSPMPKIDIRTFERSHGLHIFTDLSHRTSLHVGESTPYWIGEQRQATSELGGVVQQLGVEIQEHMKLIRMWQDEAKANRRNVRSNVLGTAQKDLPYAASEGAVSFNESEFNDFLHEY